MVVMGIDAGYGRPGLSVVKFTGTTWDHKQSKLVFSGFFETERKSDKNTKVAVDDARRIAESCEWMRTKVLEHEPDLVVVEMPISGAKSALAIKGMAMAAGYTIALLTLMKATLQFKVVYYSPYDTKRICTGNHHAEKEEMIKAAADVWPDVNFPMKKTRKNGVFTIHPGRSEAMADSLCAILTHVRLNLGKSIL
jgi:Holliday junction resolvasome RuvABC endonuclease subunit